VDELFHHRWPVGVGRVDEVDPEVNGTAKHSYGPLPVRGLTPDAGPGELYRAVTKPMHTKITPEGEGA